MQSGNLNFSLPVLKALGRGGWGVTFALSYNSQMWRMANGATWLGGGDLGEGFGWKLQAGSIRPVLYNGTFHHYVFCDATGVEYVLDQNNGRLWTSMDSTYVTFNAANNYLYFPDGSFWLMNVTSANVRRMPDLCTLNDGRPERQFHNHQLRACGRISVELCQQAPASSAFTMRVASGIFVETAEARMSSTTATAI